MIQIGESVKISTVATARIFLVVATISPSLFAQEKPKLILDADTVNEIDDMYAITQWRRPET